MQLKPRNTSRLLLWLSLVGLLLLTGCFPQVALPPQSSPAGYREQSVTIDSLFTFDGFSVGTQRIEKYRRTAFSEGVRVTQLRIVDGQAVWKVSCLLNARHRRTRRLCAVQHQGETSVLWLTGQDTEPLSGALFGPLDWRIEGIARTSPATIATYTPALTVKHGAELRGTILSLGIESKVRVSPTATREERQWLNLLTLLQATLSDPRDGDADTLNGDGEIPEQLATEGDTWKLRDRRPSDAALSTAYEESLAGHAIDIAKLGFTDTTRQLRRLRHLERTQVFDEEAGADAQRGVVRGMSLEIAAGGLWVASPNGKPRNSSLDGGRLHIRGGLRLFERTNIALGMGIQVPAFDLSSAAERYGAPRGRYDSAGFNIDLTFRHAFALVETDTVSVEPVFGLSLVTRVAGADYVDPSVPLAMGADDHAGAFYVGLGVAPRAGLQLAFPLNKIGSRVVTFVEFYPEFMFWPGQLASDSTDGAVPNAEAAAAFFERLGDGSTLQFGSALGVRLEL